MAPNRSALMGFAIAIFGVVMLESESVNLESIKVVETTAWTSPEIRQLPGVEKVEKRHRVRRLRLGLSASRVSRLPTTLRNTSRRRRCVDDNDYKDEIWLI